MTEFTKILSSHFKARSFSSFVRQLNMYSFYKTRGQKYRHEFRHPFFRKDDVKSLTYIRRKHVKKGYEINFNENLQKSDFQSTQALAMKLSKMKEILQMMAKQNRDLVLINSKMSEELRNINKTVGEKVKDLVGLMTNIIIQPDSSMALRCKELLTKIIPEGSNFNLKNIGEMLTNHNSIDMLNQHNINALNILDELNVIYKYYSTYTIHMNSNSQLINNECINSLPEINDNKSTKSSNYTSQTSYLHIHSQQIIDQTQINSPCDMSPLGFYKQLPSPILLTSNHHSYKTPEDVRFDAFMKDIGDYSSWIDECPQIKEDASKDY